MEKKSIMRRGSESGQMTLACQKIFYFFQYERRIVVRFYSSGQVIDELCPSFYPVLFFFRLPFVMEHFQRACFPIL